MNKFKVGDKVIYVGIYSPYFVCEKYLKSGIIGTVIEVTTADNIKVCWDKKPTSSKNICWCPADNCVLVSETKQIKYVIKDNMTIVILPDGRTGAVNCYYGNKFNERKGITAALSRAYDKKPFPKEEVKDEKKEPKYKFDVGDIVAVTDYGKGYANYESKFYELAPKGKWKGGYDLKEGTIVKIIGKGQHKWDLCNVYAIQDFDGKGYLIGEEGIKKVTV